MAEKLFILAMAISERIPENPQDVIKDPMMLEFLGLERRMAWLLLR